MKWYKRLNCWVDANAATLNYCWYALFGINSYLYLVRKDYGEALTYFALSILYYMLARNKDNIDGWLERRRR